MSKLEPQISSSCAFKVFTDCITTLPERTHAQFYKEKYSKSRILNRWTSAIPASLWHHQRLQHHSHSCFDSRQQHHRVAATLVAWILMAPFDFRYQQRLRYHPLPSAPLILHHPPRNQVKSTVCFFEHPHPPHQRKMYLLNFPPDLDRRQRAELNPPPPVCSHHHEGFYSVRQSLATAASHVRVSNGPHWNDSVWSLANQRQSQGAQLRDGLTLTLSLLMLGGQHGWGLEQRRQQVLILYC